jgi:glycosyltransferase involved in cell wall biosynthesis
MGLQDWVEYPGYVSDTDLAALYQACRAVIFPSLDEGLGLPVMEAIAFEKPVLCGAYASLRAVAGDVAVYFNPRLLSDIAEAIELAGQDPELLRRLARPEGSRRAIATESTLPARDYLRLFREIAA